MGWYLSNLKREYRKNVFNRRKILIIRNISGKVKYHGPNLNINS